MPRKATAGFRCKVCGKRFGMAMHLGRHMTTMHAGASIRSTTPTKTSANVGAATQLVSLIGKLQAERRGHEEAIAQIDATFGQFGIAVAPAKKRRGRPRKSPGAAKPATAKKAAKKVKAGKRKARGQFAMTGNESILRFVKAAGNKGVPGAEIVKHLKAEGRGVAGAYVMIGKLVQEKKLKKEKIKGAKGSSYTAA